MKIPSELEAKLKDNHELYGWAMQCVYATCDHIKSNSMVFFPEYTDHGIDHIELTLQAAVDMATSESKNMLSDFDSAVLIVSVALHDFGMYITRDGFESLIADDDERQLYAAFKEKTWKEAWHEFMEEAKRFDGRKLRSLFGEKYQAVRNLPINGCPWEDTDYLLVGEFLRRQHPRLSHEIAVYGMPSINGDRIRICRSDTSNYKFLSDISGLVARSHGMDLRNCLPYLEKNYNNKINPRRVHVIYLASLLRLADYFQIQSNRAPASRTNSVKLRSQLSAKEWRVHQSISDIHNTTSDPEAINVIANPGDVETFLKIKGWLTGLQNELDRSWAVLGEVFGLYQHNELHKLGLNIRRVKSNIDEIEKFALTVKYYPEKLAFSTSDADLLKLLVGPLYSNDETVGLRELIQNAVDAVRELKYLTDRGYNFLESDFYNQESDVLIEFAVDEKRQPTEIIITDKGVGMTFETLRDYFLRAGASYRQSDSWKALYSDEQGHSQILRTGRFGVGALAAFLLGNKIQVTTRYARSNPDQAISFSGHLDDELISIERVVAPIGTKIIIYISEKMRPKVVNIVPRKHEDKIEVDRNYNHYLLSQPSVGYKTSEENRTKYSALFLPQADDVASEDWRCFTAEGFSKIFWTYENKYPALSCNGIIVIRNLWYSNFEIDLGVRIFSTPRLSVFDRDGNLPLNLQRTDLATRILPFKNELLESIMEDLISFAYAYGPTNSRGIWLIKGYVGLLERQKIQRPAHWAISNEGFLLNDPHLIRRQNPKYIILAFGEDIEGFGEWAENIRKKLTENFVLILASDENLTGTHPRIKGILGDILDREYIVNIHLRGINYTRMAAYLPIHIIENAERLNPGKKIKQKIEHLRNHKLDDNWICYNYNSPGVDAEQVGRSISNLDPDTSIVFFVLEVDSWDLEKFDETLAKKWSEISPSPVVPFNAKRREKTAQSLKKECNALIANYKNRHVLEK